MTIDYCWSTGSHPWPIQFDAHFPKPTKDDETRSLQMMRDSVSSSKHKPIESKVIGDAIKQTVDDFDIDISIPID